MSFGGTIALGCPWPATGPRSQVASCPNWAGGIPWDGHKYILDPTYEVTYSGVNDPNLKCPSNTTMMSLTNTNNNATINSCVPNTITNKSDQAQYLAQQFTNFAGFIENATCPTWTSDFGGNKCTYTNANAPPNAPVTTTAYITPSILQTPGGYPFN